MTSSCVIAHFCEGFCVIGLSHSNVSISSSFFTGLNVIYYDMRTHLKGHSGNLLRNFYDIMKDNHTILFFMGNAHGLSYATCKTLSTKDDL